MSRDRLDVDLERFHAGDEDLFEEVVHHYSARLLPYLRRYAGANTDARDLLQDLWLRAYRKRDTFDGRGSLFGWLLRIARTVGLAAVAKSDPAAANEAPESAAATSADSGLLLDEIRRAVLGLPERQRDVVLLRIVEGLSTAETARALQCKEGTVKATLHQATRKLHELLKEAVR